MNDHQKKKEDSSGEISPRTHQMSVDESGSEICVRESYCEGPQMLPEFNTLSPATSKPAIDIDDCIDHTEKMLHFFLSLREMGCKNISTDENASEKERILEEGDISGDIIKSYIPQNLTLIPFEPLISKRTTSAKDSTDKHGIDDSKPSINWAEEYVDIPQSVLAAESIDSSEGATTEDNAACNEFSPSGNTSQWQQRNRVNKNRKCQSKSPDNTRLDNGGQSESQDVRSKMLPANESTSTPSQKIPIRHNKRNPANKTPRFENKNFNRSHGNGGTTSSDNLASTSAERSKSDDAVKRESNSLFNRKGRNNQHGRESHPQALVPLQSQTPQYQPFQHSFERGQHGQSFRFPPANRHQRALVPFQTRFQKPHFARFPSEKRLQAPGVHQARFQGHQFVRFPSGSKQQQEIRPPYQDTSVPPPQLPYNASAPRYQLQTYYPSHSIPRLPNINQFQSCIQYYDNNGIVPVFNDGMSSPNTTTIITPSDSSLMVMRQESILLASPEYYYYPLQQ